jgi:rhodanese-related sulfurtransferase
MYEESYGGIMLKQHYNLFAEEKKDRLEKLGYEGESVYSNRTTESVASIFAANAEFIDSMTGKTNHTNKFETMSAAPTEDILQNTSSMLLLDLRDVEDYRMAHVKGAISFPSPNIARDKFIKQIWHYKNKEDKIIIIYHEDEKSVIEAAELLVEKEFKNVYIMTSGFEIFAEENPELIEGKNAYVNNNIQTSTFSYKKPVKSLTD